MKSESEKKKVKVVCKAGLVCSQLQLLHTLASLLHRVCDISTIPGYLNIYRYGVIGKSIAGDIFPLLQNLIHVQNCTFNGQKVICFSNLFGMIAMQADKM